MDRVISDRDLVNLVLRGKKPLTKDGRAVSIPAREESAEEKQAKALQLLAEAAVQAVKDVAKTMQVNADLVQKVVAKLKAIQEAPITIEVPEIKIPETKIPAGWKEVEGEVVERDYRDNIKRFKLRRVA